MAVIDTKFVKGADGLTYNRAGYPISPKLSDERVGALAIFLALLFPLVVIWGKWESPLSMGLLRNTRLFEVARANHLLSQNQIDTADLFLTCLVLFVCFGVAYYLRKNLTKFSIVHPPPMPLKRLWLRQIILMLGIGLIFIFVPLAIGDLVYWGAPADLLGPKRSMFAVLILLSLGVYFTADAIGCASLYVCFYFKFWKAFE